MTNPSINPSMANNNQPSAVCSAAQSSPSRTIAPPKTCGSRTESPMDSYAALIPAFWLKPGLDRRRSSSSRKWIGGGACIRHNFRKLLCTEGSTEFGSHYVMRPAMQILMVDLHEPSQCFRPGSRYRARGRANVSVSFTLDDRGQLLSMLHEIPRYPSRTTTLAFDLA